MSRKKWQNPDKNHDETEVKVKKEIHKKLEKMSKLSQSETKEQRSNIKQKFSKRMTWKENEHESSEEISVKHTIDWFEMGDTVTTPSN